jgi:hypothetical protein
MAGFSTSGQKLAHGTSAGLVGWLPLQRCGGHSNDRPGLGPPLSDFRHLAVTQDRPLTGPPGGPAVISPACRPGPGARQPSACPGQAQRVGRGASVPDFRSSPERENAGPQDRELGLGTAACH